MSIKEEASKRVIVALDCDEANARKFSERLRGHTTWLKVGMTLYYQAGPALIHHFKQQGFSVFLDLKLCDIPYQVRGAARAAMRSGADILSVHALGGSAMLQAACEGVREVNPFGKVIAITILTSINQQMLKELGIEGELSQETKRLASLAQNAECDGIVCSGQEAKALRNLLGEDALIVTPGIRMKDTEKQDQARIITPERAIKAGSDYLVVGRPVIEAEDPVKVFDAFVKDVSKTLSRSKCVKRD